MTKLACQVIACFVVGCVFQSAVFAQLEIPADLQQAEQNRIDTIARATAATVCVFGAGGQGGGSGVVISADGFALTNFHVVQGNGPFMKCSMPDGKLYDSVLVGIDPTGDVALIKLLGRNNFPAARIGDSDELRVGQWCFAIGNPFLLATNFEPSVSWGLVSGVHRYQYPAGTLLEYADCIQTDAAINPGNSGGALFNSKGELVGINGRGSFEKRGRVNVGVGYAISINQIKFFLSHLKSGRLVDHATLGATVATNELGEVRVSNIIESSDAYRRGMRYDDRILSFAGRDVSTVNQFKNILGIFPKGWRVPVSVQRGDKRFDIAVRLSGVHSDQELATLIQGASGEKDVPETPIPESPEEEQEDQESAESKFDLKNVKDAKLYESRRGFANYQFNRQQLKQIWNRTKQHGDFSSVNQKWRITADVNGQKAQFVLGDDTSGLQFAGETHLLEYEAEPALQREPNDTGMLLAMHLWRKMLVSGPAGYGDAYSFGNIPLYLPFAELEPNAGENNRLMSLGEVDCIVATTDVIEANFLFDPANGQLAAMEVFPDVDVDPCVLRFLDYQVHDDLTVPREIRVHVGTKLVMTLKVDQIEFVKSGGDQQ